MRIKGLVVVICVVVLALAVLNNVRYSRVNQKAKRVEQEQDSISFVRHEKLLNTIQASTLAIDSLMQEHKSFDSIYMTNQENLLKHMKFLIHLNKQMLEQNKTQRCSISSTIHTAE